MTTQTNQLVTELLPLVHGVAAQIARRVPSHVGMDDLVGAGMLGLAGALTRFDPKRKETFKGYAEFRIRGAIIDDLRRRDIMSRDARIESKRLQSEIDQLNSILGRPADDDEIADHLGVDLEEYRTMQLKFNGSRMVSTEGMDISADNQSPLENLEENELKTRLAEGINELPERQRLVLWLYYYEEMPLREIAEMLDVTPSRVCQIRSQAVEMLKGQISEEIRLAA